MEERLMKKKKILMLVCMAVLAVTVVIPVNAAKKTNKKQIQVLNLYQDQKTDIEEAEYLVSYLEDKNIDEESVEKQEKGEWYIDIKTGKITKDSQYKRHFYNDGWTIEFKDDTVKGGYAMDGGTSMAAPMVAGAAAGIWSIYPEMTGADVKNAIVETAEDKVKSNPKAPNSADNNQNIYKFLNIKKALQYCEMKKIKEKEVAEMAEEKPETKGEKFTGTAEDMRAAMEKATNLKVVYITTADFDADGNNESFALATDDSKDPYWGYHTAEIWFVDSNGECQCIKKEENISRNDEVLGGGNLFFNYEKHEYQTSSVSCLYGVKNGQPYELQISGKYMNFRIDENRNKYIAEDPEYNEGQQYEDIFFEYDENIEEFYKITN